MTVIQERLLCMIQEIDTICRKYEIPYYLSGGCVIGAIRHKGFIPWDDDIDILLDSKYWSRFLEVFQKEMPEGRTLGCVENNIEFPNMIYRYCDTSTTEIHKNELFGDSTAGIVIDIILMDSFVDESLAWKRHMRDLLLFSDLINVYYSYNLRFDVDIPYKRYLFYTKIFGKRRVLTYLEKKLRKYENVESDYYMIRWPAGPNVFPKSVFGVPRYADFAGVSLPLPEKAGSFLRELYGDEWIEVPMAEQQNAHNTILDLERGYDIYFKEYVSRLNRKEAIREYERLKKHYIKTKHESRADIKKLWLIEGLKEKYLIEKKIQKENLDPILMFESQQYDELFELFSDYMNRQGSGDYIGSEFWSGLTRRYDPVYVDLGDDYLSIVLWLWIYQGRLSKAYKVLRARNMVKKSDYPLRLRMVSEFIEEMRKAISLYEQRNYEEAFHIVKKLIDTAACPVVNLWKLRIRLERILGTGTWEQESAWLEDCLEIFPEDGELLKYRIDAVYYKEGIENTWRDYYTAFSKTRNGIIWLEIKEIFQKNVEWAIGQLQKLINENDYKAAFKMAKAWKRIERDCSEIEYYFCLSLCYHDKRSEKSKVKTVLRYIRRYPEDERFKELLGYIWQDKVEGSVYPEYRMNLYLASEWKEYERLRDELLQNERPIDKLDKIELLARIYSKLGETRLRFEMLRFFLNNGGDSHYVRKSVKTDMRKMLSNMYEAKTEQEREILIEEWKMKYPDVDESVKYLIELQIFPEHLKESLKEWLWKLVEGINYIENISNIHNGFLMYKNDSKDEEEDELEELSQTSDEDLEEIEDGIVEGIEERDSDIDKVE